MAGHDAPDTLLTVSMELHAALLQACTALDGTPLTGLRTPARTNAVLPVEIGAVRVLLRAEVLLTCEAARARVRVVDDLRAQGVPWARPLELLEIPLADSMLPVSVWEWVERVDGAPTATAVVRALRALHQAVPPSGLLPRFGSVSAELERFEVLAPWAERFRAVEAYALRWPQRRVVHGDALSVNLLHTAGGVTFVDTDMLAMGHPLVDWQYLARDARSDPEKTPVDWSLDEAELDHVCDAPEPGWRLPEHPLWNAQRLLHLRRRALLWDRSGRDHADLEHLRAVAATITPPPDGPI